MIKRVTREELQEIHEMVRQGERVKDIARQMARTRRTIYRAMQHPADDQPAAAEPLPAVVLPDGSRAELAADRPCWLAELLPHCDSTDPKSRGGGSKIIPRRYAHGLLAVHLADEGLTCREIGQMLRKEFSYVSRLIIRTRATLAAWYEGVEKPGKIGGVRCRENSHAESHAESHADSHADSQASGRGLKNRGGG